MFTMMQLVYEYLLNYVFGTNIYLVMAILLMVTGFMIYNGFSFDVVAITFVGLFVVGNIWLFPQWTLGFIAIVSFFILGYIIYRILER